MPFRVVVLPAPFAPIRQTSSPSADVEVDALDRVDAAVGDLELAELEQRGGWPRRPTR